ncbi:MAG TPA: FAD-binding protein, partial [Myxococcaceae bacterium]|nr:FAD-binding protein [Myxococcaceae bacterium]
MSHPSAASPAVPQPSRPVSAWVLGQLASIVGAEHVLHDAAALRTYSSDALATFAVEPGVVVLPASTEEVVEVVKTARAARLPVVPRGSGTGLSGGALPVPGCILLGLSRMRRILEVDLDNGFARVEPGVFNLDVSKQLAPAGYYYAPDPSSQSVCSIGGNVAENSGGAHCLKYGFTVNHVLAARLVLEDGAVVDLGSAVPDAPGFDLLGVLVGSEGLLGVVTEVTLRILRKPE